VNDGSSSRLHEFDQKLVTLPATWSRALQADIEALRDDLISGFGLESLVVGSGGSFVTALLIAELAEILGGCLARALTPMELVAFPERARSRHVWLVSASGSNTDILAAADCAIRAEARQISLIANQPETPLARLIADRALRARTHMHQASDPNDGFLATHSLIMNAVLLARVAASIRGEPALPAWSEISLTKEFTFANWSTHIAASARNLFTRPTIIIAHDPALMPAAALLETNLWEAALANAQMVDLRNFAHGRHVWPHRRPEDVAVVGFVSDAALAIWNHIEMVLPPVIPRLAVTTDTTVTGSREASLLAAFELTRVAGQASGVDPGRPGVGDFGRELYKAANLTSYRRKDHHVQAPVWRKLNAARTSGWGAIGVMDWERHLSHFLTELAATTFHGLVLDYDGTVVDTGRRRDPPEPAIAATLQRLLEQGVPIAFATGRGGSMADMLRRVLLPALWTRVLIGYYNGGLILDLSEEIPPGENRADLVAFDAAITQHRALSAVISERRFHRFQLSIVPRPPLAAIDLRALLEESMEAGRLPMMRSFCSAHAVDVLSDGVGKRNLLRHLEAQATGTTLPRFLCIGDSGAWPGNDFELLSAPLSLSVDRVSVEPDRCWNLLPAGVGGSRGLLALLLALRPVSPSGFQLIPGEIRPPGH
jgi:hydroxymethylpyrimidine pyrophosphatase-like HAD family hydrolase/fructoselysine-6-P-deglycase FrlB-like protein